MKQQAFAAGESAVDGVVSEKKPNVLVRWWRAYMAIVRSPATEDDKMQGRT
jgi:hypothetical protein